MPSLGPSPEPSISPTPVPTLVPTALCFPGQYLKAESDVCTSCGAGKYSNVSQPPWPSSCVLCQGGTYTSQIASSSCSVCPVGKFSNEERTGCVTCYAGQYTLNKTSCVDCASGTYAPRALAGSCLLCGAGSHTSKRKAAVTCTPCDAGSFSSAQSVNCTLCAAGFFSGSGTSTCEACSAGKAAEKPGASGCATCQAGRYSLAEAQLCGLCAAGKSSSANSQACTSCAEGFFSSTKDSAQCTACAAGSYSTTSGSINCTSCSPGSAQGATGQSSCIVCSPGSYSRAYGEASCSSCTDNSYSFEESSSCTRCLKEYFYFDGSCLTCPEGTKCDGDGTSTLSHLLVQPGWWRISEDTDVVRLCTHEGSRACRGGLNFSAGYCIDGHQGILCAVCSDDYYFDPEESTCLSCDDLLSDQGLSSLPLILFSIISSVFFAFIVCMSCTSDTYTMIRHRERSVRMEKLVCRFTDFVIFARDLLSYLDGSKVKLKALASFFQIAQNIGVSFLFHRRLPCVSFRHNLKAIFRLSRSSIVTYLSPSVSKLSLDHSVFSTLTFSPHLASHAALRIMTT